MNTIAKEQVSLEEYMALQLELDEVRRQHGIESPSRREGRISKAISAFFDQRENRKKISVSKKTYLLLTILTGIVGGHLFYTRKWYVAGLYLITCWSGFSIAMSLVDLLIAIPMRPDEDGNILI